MDAVLTCMVSESLGTGERSRRFAAEVAEYLGLAGGIALRDYSRAIRLAFELLDLPPASKVLLSPLSPAIYESVLLDLGLKPLYAEVSAENGCLEAAEVERLLPAGPGAVLLTNPLGFVAELEPLAAFGVPLIEDITMGIGGTIGERRSGSFGRFVIVRLEQEDIITTGGGALVLASGKRDLAALRQAPLPPSAHLSDMNAALGLTQISSIERHLSQRKEIARAFSQALQKSRHKPLIQSGDGDNVWYSFPVLLTGSMKDAIQYARKKGIETIPGFHDTIASRLDFGDHAFPNARALFLRCILFPLYPSLGKQNVGHISKVLSTLP